MSSLFIAGSQAERNDADRPKICSNSVLCFVAVVRAAEFPRVCSWYGMMLSRRWCVLAHVRQRVRLV